MAKIGGIKCRVGDETEGGTARGRRVDAGFIGFFERLGVGNFKENR
jgi:hypothetical protein